MRAAGPGPPASRTHITGEADVSSTVGRSPGKASTSSATDRGTPIRSGGTCATSSTRALQLTFGAGALVSAVAAIGTFAALCTGPRLRPGQAPPPGSADHSPVGVPL